MIRVQVTEIGTDGRSHNERLVYEFLRRCRAVGIVDWKIGIVHFLGELASIREIFHV